MLVMVNHRAKLKIRRLPTIVNNLQQQYFSVFNIVHFCYVIVMPMVKKLNMFIINIFLFCITYQKCVMCIINNYA